MENRIIKFRAWNPEIKEMHFSSEEILFDKREFYPWAFEIGTSGYPQSEWVFMQFTGLKDKNRKDIYEGDVLSTEDGSVIVGWSDRFASFVLNKKGWMYQHYFGEGLNPEDCAIVGNIHQNPDLL